MERAVVLLAVRAVGEPVADGHVGSVVEERRKELAHGFGGVGVVPVDHDVVICVNVAQHLTHDVALTLSRLGPHHGPVRPRDVGRAVGGVVVVHVDGRLGQFSSEVVDDLGDGYCLVVARYQDGDGRAVAGSVFSHGVRFLFLRLGGGSIRCWFREPIVHKPSSMRVLSGCFAIVSTAKRYLPLKGYMLQ